MKSLFLLILVISNLNIQAQDWKPWVPIKDGASDLVQISYKKVPNTSGTGNVMYYRLKNGYSADVCGEIYLIITWLDGKETTSYCNVSLKANETKEASFMNRFNVSSFKGISNVKLKNCNGDPIGSALKSEVGHYARCDEKLPFVSHGPLGWCGPKRNSYSSALNDAKVHNAEFNHQAGVCTAECPSCVK